jgi:hypothetical protein
MRQARHDRLYGPLTQPGLLTFANRDSYLTRVSTLPLPDSEPLEVLVVRGLASAIVGCNSYVNRESVFSSAGSSFAASSLPVSDCVVLWTRRHHYISGDITVPTNKTDTQLVP